ncbi:MAG: hypothetical protein J3R72DRAFT_460673 [Linnemannia gamsii]|nr:MAG: hypothetical protein J3R72DRAFT_460673 [Linnemannia gamsii]
MFTLFFFFSFPFPTRTKTEKDRSKLIKKNLLSPHSPHSPHKNPYPLHGIFPSLSCLSSLRSSFLLILSLSLFRPSSQKGPRMEKERWARCECPLNTGWKIGKENKEQG